MFFLRWPQLKTMNIEGSTWSKDVKTKFHKTLLEPFQKHQKPRRCFAKKRWERRPEVIRAPGVCVGDHENYGYI